jgi:hypothetical protein
MLGSDNRQPAKWGQETTFPFEYEMIPYPKYPNKAPQEVSALRIISKIYYYFEELRLNPRESRHHPREPFRHSLEPYRRSAKTGRPPPEAEHRSAGPNRHSAEAHCRSLE